MLLCSPCARALGIIRTRLKSRAKVTGMRKSTLPLTTTILLLGLTALLPSLHAAEPSARGGEDQQDKSEQAVPAQFEIATFGEGCFWCSEAMFEQLEGVQSVVSGFSGGQLKNPTYKQVLTGRTGHAEVVQVTFDPKVISYKDLLEVFWKTHDPTTLNRQGPDVGTQYRSVIFYHSDEQKELAVFYKRRLNESRVFSLAGGDRDQPLRGVLSGRGLSPGVLRAQQAAALLLPIHPPEGRQV